MMWPMQDLRSANEKRKDVLSENRPRTTLSFYRYVKLEDPNAFRALLLSKWSELGCLGRIYVAHEGINAQMNVPTEHWEEFDAWVQAQSELAGIPYKLAVEEGDVPSFFKLTIKYRSTNRVILEKVFTCCFIIALLCYKHDQSI